MAEVQPSVTVNHTGAYHLILNQSPGVGVMSWSYSQAESQCTQLGKYPVSIVDEDEFTLIKSLWDQTYSSSQSFFIGAKLEGNWFWVDGTDYDYQGFWAAGQQVFNGDKCAYVDGDLAYSQDCTDSIPFGIICEQSIPTPAPSMYPSTLPSMTPSQSPTTIADRNNRDSNGGGLTSSDMVGFIGIGVLGAFLGCCVLVGCAAMIIRMQRMQSEFDRSQEAVGSQSPRWVVAVDNQDDPIPGSPGAKSTNEEDTRPAAQTYAEGEQRPTFAAADEGGLKDPETPPGSPPMGDVPPGTPGPPVKKLGKEQRDRNDSKFGQILADMDAGDSMMDDDVVADLQDTPGQL